MTIAGQHVLYNDGTEGGEDVFALVTKRNDDETLNVFVIPKTGDPHVENGVPRRDKNDYGPEGGGRTWHV